MDTRRHPPCHPGCGRPPADRGRPRQRQDHHRAAQGRQDAGNAWSPSSGSCSCPSPAPRSGRSPTGVAEHLPRAVRDHLEIRTFHAFFLDLVRAHGPLLTGTPAVFLPPDAENPRKADHDGDWDAETRDTRPPRNLRVRPAGTGHRHPARTQPRAAAPVQRPVSARHRRRVPGHQPGPVARHPGAVPGQHDHLPRRSRPADLRRLRPGSR